MILNSRDSCKYDDRKDKIANRVQGDVKGNDVLQRAGGSR